MTPTPLIRRELASNVVRFVAERYLIPTDEILGACREESLIWARSVAFALLRRQGWTLEAIGRAFWKDHGTVLHALRRHRARVESENLCRDDWESAVLTFETAIPETRRRKQTFEWKTDPETETEKQFVPDPQGKGVLEYSKPISRSSNRGANA